MKTILRSLILWCVLLAVPFQGFASATMLLCAPAPAHAAQGQHDHAAMMAQHQHHASAAASHHDGAAMHHDDAKCGSCAACCVGAAMAPLSLVNLPVLAPQFVSIPFRSGHVPTVDLAHPERPPRSSLA